MLERLRRKLKSAMPISTPAQDNFEQQSPDTPGAGHMAFVQHETGAGTSRIVIQRALARVEAQLSVTIDPGLRVTFLAAQRNLQNQLVKASGSGLHKLMVGSPVPNIGFPMGTFVDAFSGHLSQFPDSTENGKISPKATFELAGSARSKISQGPPRARIAGGQDPLPDSYYTRNALGEYPGQFNYDPGRVDKTATPKTDSMHVGLDTGQQTSGAAVASHRMPYAPGRTFQDLHRGPDFGPYGRGLTTSMQYVPNHHGSRSKARKE